MNIKKNLLLAGVVIVGIMFLFVFGEIALPAQAGPADNVTGYAWSSNIGWISFNCTNTDSCSSVDYGVNLDRDTGVMSGYAWSSNIGWIDFASSDIAPDGGSGGVNVNLDTGKMTGWAKALSGDDDLTDNWDGWISMSGTATDGSSYGGVLDVVSGQFGGWVWGSDIVGWIDIAASTDGSGNPPIEPPIDGCVGVCVDPDPSAATLTLSADPSEVDYDGSTTLTWTSSNILPGSCNASNGWSGPKEESGTEVRSNLIVDKTTYELDCTSDVDGSPVHDEFAVTVTDPSEPTVNVWTDPFQINLGETTDVNWLTFNVDSCTPTSNPVDNTWDGLDPIVSGSGIHTTSPVDSTTYTLDCTGPGGPASNYDSVAVISDFSMNSDLDTIEVTLLAEEGDATSNNAFITVIPIGFSEGVTLTSDVSSVISGASDDFDNPYLSAAEIGSGIGSTFNVTVPEGTTPEIYVITVKGTSDSGVDRFVTINLNVDFFDPFFEEI